MTDLPLPPQDIALAHFIVSDDIERSRRFYTEVLGGRVAFSGLGGVSRSPTAGSLSMAAAAADDKPAVILETPRDPDRVDSFLNIRVKDIAAVYAEWSAWGAHFLMPRRSPDRSRADHGPSGGLEPRSLAIEPIPRVARSG